MAGVFESLVGRRSTSDGGKRRSPAELRKEAEEKAQRARYRAASAALKDIEGQIDMRWPDERRRALARAELRLARARLRDGDVAGAAAAGRRTMGKGYARKLTTATKVMVTRRRKKQKEG